MKNRTLLKTTLSVLLVLSMLLATFGTVVASAAGTGQQTATVTYGDVWDGTQDAALFEALTNASNTTKAYTVTTAEQLAAIAKTVNAGNDLAGYTFTVTKNLDLDSIEWIPIGNTSNTPFKGTIVGALDGVAGAAVTIGNLSIQNTALARLGLVGTQAGGGMKHITLADPVIKTSKLTAGAFVGCAEVGATAYENLTVVNLSMTVTATVNYFGGMVGVVKKDSVWTNCKVDGMTFTAEGTGVSYYGGFIGDAQAGTITFTNCSVEDYTLSVGKVSRCGGFVGSSTVAATYTNCTVDNHVAKVSADGGSYIGGFVGYPATASSYTDCTVTDYVLSGDDKDAQTETDYVKMTYVGGFTGGAATYPTFVRCSANNIELNMKGAGNSAAQLIGGFIGLVRKGTAVFDTVTTSGTITVTGEPGYNIGGIAGIIRNDATFTNCISMVDLYFPDGQALQVGGITGCLYNDTANATLTNCYFGGSIVAPTGAAIGGMVGINQGAIVSFTDCQMDGMVDVGGDYIGAWVGAWDIYTTSFSLSDCVVTGTAAGSIDSTDYYWFGFIAPENAETEALSTVNCYSNAGLPAALDFNNEIKSLASVSLDSAKWEKKGTTNTPVLKLASAVADTTYAGADLSWFTPVTSKTLVISDEADLLGLAMYARLAAFRATAYTYVLEENAMNLMENMTPALAALFPEGFFEKIAPKFAVKNGDLCVTLDTLNVKYQTKDDGAADTETFRLIATVGKDAFSYDAIGFILTDSQNQSVTLTTDTVWQSVLGDGKTYVPSEATGDQVSAGYGEDSRYFFLVEQTNISLDATFTVQAFVTQDGMTVKGQTYTFTVRDLL